MLIFSGWEMGSKAEWFSGLGSFAAVAVALWQSIVIRQQAKEAAKEDAERFKEEIAAANRRTVEEVQAAERRAQRELEAANQRHAVELAQQRELARVQLVHAQEQEFKLAVIRVSKAVGAYTHELATLVAETQRIVALSTRQERDDAMKPIAKRMNIVAKELVVEVSGAHMLTNNDQLHAALDRISSAATNAPIEANQYENTVIMAGETPSAVPIYLLMNKLQEIAADALRLAGKLLVTGLE